MDSFVFMYRNLGGMNDNIKIEINYSLRSYIFESVKRAISIEKLGVSAQVLCLEPIEFVCSKNKCSVKQSSSERSV